MIKFSISHARDFISNNNNNSKYRQLVVLSFSYMQIPASNCDVNWSKFSLCIVLRLAFAHYFLTINVFLHVAAAYDNCSQYFVIKLRILIIVPHSKRMRDFCFGFSFVEKKNVFENSVIQNEKSDKTKIVPEQRSLRSNYFVRVHSANLSLIRLTSEAIGLPNIAIQCKP